MTHEILVRVLGLLAVSIMVAIAARRLALPYTVGLVVAGMALAIFKPLGNLALTHDLIFDVLLPPLLFEAALNLHWSALRRDWLPVLGLSIAGVAISAAVVAAGMTALVGWPLAPALVFGILIAATDPVAVIAMFKESGIGGRLRLLVEGESLANDGVAAVLFVLALGWTAGDALGPRATAQALIGSSAGGILIGLVSGAVLIAIAWRTTDHLVETAITTVGAFGSFLLAEQLQMSGVLACVAAGILFGNVSLYGSRRGQILTEEAGRFLLVFWDFAAFLANSLVFLLIGVAVAGMPFSNLGLGAIAIAIALVLLGRALSVYPFGLALAWSRWAIPLSDQHVLWWGGLRGALALALALALPATLPLHREIQIAAFGVVAFSVLIQGISMPLFLRLLGLTQEPM